MVAQNTVRSYGENLDFRLVEGLWLYQKNRQIRNFFTTDLFHFICAQHVLSVHLI